MCGKPFVFYSISNTYTVYDINLSLRKAQEKWRQVYLNAIFYLCFATPRAAGRDVQRSKATAQIPESEGFIA